MVEASTMVEITHKYILATRGIGGWWTKWKIIHDKSSKYGLGELKDRNPDLKSWRIG